jgi:hypothetical protein
MKKLLFFAFVLVWCIALSFSKCSAQLHFHWRQYSGPVTGHIQNADTSTTEVTGLDQVGIYGFELTVTSDSTGLSGKDSMTVTVIKGVLGIEQDSVYHPIRRPKIKKLEIQTAVRGDKIYLLIKSPRQQQIQAAICDITGRMIGKTDINVKEGENYVSLPKPRISGIYILRFLTTYYDKQTKKIFF